MNRPFLILLRCCAAVLLAVAPAGGQESRDSGKPLSATEALPPLPVSGLLDEANVFGPAESEQLTADLEDFRKRIGIPLYVVTANYIFGGTLEEFGERMATESLQGRSGIVMLYERGSGQLNYSATPGALGRSEDMKQLFLFGSRAAASLPVTESTAGRLRAAVHALTTAAEEWKAGGVLPDPDAPPPPPLPSPAPESESPPATAPAAATPPSALATRPAPPLPPPAGGLQRHIFAAVAAALLVGSALLFGFHRWQERIESRVNAQYYFPDVRVGQRLGAPQGGGVVAAISFREKP